MPMTSSALPVPASWLPGMGSVATGTARAGLRARPARCWLRPGDRLAVRDMGTWFGGRINLEVEMAPDGGSVSVNLRWRDFAALPTRVLMRLRSGDGRPLRSATVNGAAARTLPGDLIQLPAKTRAQLRIVGKFD